MINTRGRYRRLALLLCSVFAFAAVGSGVAQADDVTPQATQFNGVCEADEFCLYFMQDLGIPAIDYGTARDATCDSTYANNNFPGYSALVDNNTRSYWNRSDITVRIYDGPNYGHPVLADLRPGSGNLPRSAWDRASSHRSIGSGC